MDVNPLVSIIIPTYNRTELLMQRSLPSVMGQTYPNIEIMVVGDGTEEETVEAMEKIDDPKVSFTNLPHYPDYPQNLLEYWAVGGVPTINWALDNAKGEWVYVVADDDALIKDAIEVLLREGLTQNVEYIYGKGLVVSNKEARLGVFGRFPPSPGGVSPGLWKASLNFRYDINSWTNQRPCDWDLVYRMIESGVIFGFVPKVTYKYYPNTLQILNMMSSEEGVSV